LGENTESEDVAIGFPFLELVLLFLAESRLCTDVFFFCF